MLEDRGHTIDASTRLVGLLGHPVRHSRSPILHNAAFRARGINMAYAAFDVSSEDLGAAVEGMRALKWAGANVTVPHKEQIFPLLDRADRVSARVKAVNTVVKDDGYLVGYNTDVHGFLMALEQGWGRGPSGARALVLGAGGAARAVVAALVAGGADEVLVHNRTSEKAVDLCAEACVWGSARCRAVGHGELEEAAGSAELVVNATTVGLEPEVKACPLPVDTIREHHVVMDLVYGYEPTPLVQEARRRGASALDGWEMLIQQAARSFELWTKVNAPIEVIREQVRRR